MADLLLRSEQTGLSKTWDPEDDVFLSRLDEVWRRRLPTGYFHSSRTLFCQAGTLKVQVTPRTLFLTPPEVIMLSPMERLASVTASTRSLQRTESVETTATVATTATTTTTIIANSDAETLLSPVAPPLGRPMRRGKSKTAASTLTTAATVIATMEAGALHRRTSAPDSKSMDRAARAAKPVNSGLMRSPLSIVTDSQEPRPRHLEALLDKRSAAVFPASDLGMFRRGNISPFILLQPST